MCTLLKDGQIKKNVHNYEGRTKYYLYLCVCVCVLYCIVCLLARSVFYIKVVDDYILLNIVYTSCNIIHTGGLNHGLDLIIEIRT